MVDDQSMSTDSGSGPYDRPVKRYPDAATPRDRLAERNLAANRDDYQAQARRQREVEADRHVVIPDKPPDPYLKEGNPDSGKFSRQALVRAVEESLEETRQAFRDWAIERTLELAGDLVHPVLGRVINIAFKVREALDDKEALASPGSDRELHVPLFRAAPGI